MDKMLKAMQMIEQGMALLQEATSMKYKMAENEEKEEESDDMEEEETEAVLPMDASDKKSLVISMMKKKGM
jgi:hypothetical protein